MQSRGVLLSLLQNRSCPKCHTRQTKDWLDARTTEVLPTYYFHVTITVPQGLRALLRTNQRDGYALLMKAAADAIIENMGAGLWPLWVPRHDQLLQDAQHRLGETDYERERSAGGELDFEQATAKAIELLMPLTDQARSTSP